jgi:hypothetical protein
MGHGWAAFLQIVDGGKDVPAVLALLGVSVSHPKARLGGHALNMYPVGSTTSTPADATPALAGVRSSSRTLLAEGSDGVECVAVIEEPSPDVMRLAIVLPVIDALEMVQVVARVCSGPTIIMYSGHPASRWLPSSWALVPMHAWRRGLPETPRHPGA